MASSALSRACAVPNQNTDCMPLKQHLAVNPNADRGRLLLQVAHCIQKYHDTDHMIHGAIKMVNVVVDEEGNAQLLKSATSTAITAPPRAPATVEESLPMTTATDIYAFAWPVFHVFTHIDPQDLARTPKIMSIIAAGVKPNRPGPDTLPTLRGLNDAIWAILLQCWEIAPCARPSISEVLRALSPCQSQGREAAPVYVLSQGETGRVIELHNGVAGL